jgi:hypothetical protein
LTNRGSWNKVIVSIEEGSMAEHILHKKETKKAPQKTLKEKRAEKKNKNKAQGSNIPDN